MAKTTFRLLLSFAAIIVFFFFNAGIGFTIGELIFPLNPFGVMLSYLFLYAFFAYLSFRAGIQGNDGIQPDTTAIMFGWLMLVWRR